MKLCDSKKKTVYRMQGYTEHILNILRFSIAYLFSECGQIWGYLRICWGLLKSSLMENLMEKLIVYEILLNKNNRVYGTKYCCKHHSDICFSFLSKTFTSLWPSSKN